MSFRARSGAAEMRSAKLASLKQSSSAPAQRRIASVRAFRSLVWDYWKKSGRHNLPWRKTRDPYKILVSEIMLQQTQVDRVIPYYSRFLKRFPTVQALASASLVDVLKVWSGLGYNRRAKYLHDAAKLIVEKHGGEVPTVYSELVELPGVGDYTAKAMRVFSLNQPEVFIETNIRTAFMHHFSEIWTLNVHISDEEIQKMAIVAAKGLDPREWHSALMDYGAHLKRSGVRTNHRSVHYAKQSKFEGSLRQVRGALLRAHACGEDIKRLRNQYAEKFDQALHSLVKDGLVAS